MTKENQNPAPQEIAAVIQSLTTNPLGEEVGFYGGLRVRLLQRREFLRARLVQVDALLELLDQGPTPRPDMPQPASGRDRPYGALTHAVKDVLAQGPQTKRQILAALAARGMHLGPSPLEILDEIIYTKNFQRAGKLFALASTAR